MTIEEEQKKLKDFLDRNQDNNLLDIEVSLRLDERFMRLCAGNDTIKLFHLTAFQILELLQDKQVNIKVFADKNKPLQEFPNIEFMKEYYLNNPFFVSDDVVEIIGNLIQPNVAAFHIYSGNYMITANQMNWLASAIKSSNIKELFISKMEYDAVPAFIDIISNTPSIKAVAFDVDGPDKMPRELADALISNPSISNLGIKWAGYDVSEASIDELSRVIRGKSLESLHLELCIPNGSSEQLMGAIASGEIKALHFEHVRNLGAELLGRVIREICNTVEYFGIHSTAYNPYDIALLIQRSSTMKSLCLGFTSGYDNQSREQDEGRVIAEALMGAKENLERVTINAYTGAIPVIAALQESNVRSFGLDFAGDCYTGRGMRDIADAMIQFLPGSKVNRVCLPIDLQRMVQDITTVKEGRIHLNDGVVGSFGKLLYNMSTDYVRSM